MRLAAERGLGKYDERRRGADRGEGGGHRERGHEFQVMRTPSGPYGSVEGVAPPASSSSMLEEVPAPRRAEIDRRQRGGRSRLNRGGKKLNYSVLLCSSSVSSELSQPQIPRSGLFPTRVEIVEIAYSSM